MSMSWERGSEDKCEDKKTEHWPELVTTVNVQSMAWMDIAEKTALLKLQILLQD